MEYKIILHKDTLGITQRALKALRDELAQRIEHELIVFQVPSGAHSECGCYGFFLVDRTAGEIAIVGDGFRADGCGEGGAGARAALALLTIYHLAPIEMVSEDANPYRGDIPSYQKTVDRVLGLVTQFSFEIAKEKPPSYIDWCFSHRR